MKQGSLAYLSRSEQNYSVRCIQSQQYSSIFSDTAVQHLSIIQGVENLNKRQDSSYILEVIVIKSNVLETENLFVITNCHEKVFLNQNYAAQNFFFKGVRIPSICDSCCNLSKQATVSHFLWIFLRTTAGIFAPQQTIVSWSA